MKNFKTTILWSLGFLCLNLYANGLPRLFSFEVMHWFLYWPGFFLLAFVVSRYLLGQQGLRDFGLTIRSGWFAQLGLGFCIGLGLWAMKYFCFWVLGKFSIAGLADAALFMPMLAQALLAMFFAAIINDVTIRGYWFAFSKKTQRMSLFMVLAVVLYCLDDAWNEGFALMNVAFSAVLGLSLAYAVYKTGALWLCTGIHWGGNMMYRLLYGFNGQGVLRLEGQQDGPLFDIAGLLVTALLLPILYVLLRKSGRPAVPPLLVDKATNSKRTRFAN